jgi:hypothetical protein
MTLLYLDLNHWIELSKARLGKPTPSGPYQEIYAHLQSLTRIGRVITPLGEIHYSEMRDRIARFEQRNDVTLTMSELSRFWSLPPRHTLLRVQLRGALAKRFGVPDLLGPNVALVGHGVGYAQRGRALEGGFSGRQTPIPNHAVALEESLAFIESRVGSGWRFSRRDDLLERDLWSALADLFSEAAEFLILRGPSASDMPELAALGYRPEELPQQMIDVAEREKRMKAVLMAKPTNRRRPGAVVGAASLVFDSTPQILSQALRDLGLTREAWEELTEQDLSAIVADTPILDIEGSLRLGRLKSGDYRIEVNDLYDMAALGVAATCCDVVATDSSARHMLVEADVDARYNRRILSKATDLLAAVLEMEEAGTNP